MKPALDQFFTQPAVARRCWRHLCTHLPRLTQTPLAHLCFVEPSAGDGAFYDLLPAGAQCRIGMDIAPRRAEFLQVDFLSTPPAALPLPQVHARAQAEVVVIGNPPFGQRGKFAVQFFNRAAQLADTIAFIVPVIFRKHFIHKQLPPDWRWISTLPLARDSFCTPHAATYAVNTEFQIWTRLPSKHKNRRLLAPPPRTHKDFAFWQYNNTREALKVFDNPFEFAVPCQGWQDYTRRVTRACDCEKTKQWMLFKPHTATARRRLLQEIDYTQLAQQHTTSTPGFRKGDLIQEYLRRYG